LGQRGNPVWGTGLPRSRSLWFGIATATALLLHGGLLLFRLDASGASHAIGARVMAVRLLPLPPVDSVAPPTFEVEPVAGRGREQTDSVSVSAADASRSAIRTNAAKRESTQPGAGAVNSPAEPGSQAAPTNAGLAPAPDYLSRGHLDPGPRPLGDIEPEYPEAANLQEGMVVLRLLISETGVVDNVAVVSADPKGVFDSAAVDAFKAAKFSPGMVLGMPVKSQITVEVEFLPINRGARISGRTY
jgi:TonB family protein